MDVQALQHMIREFRDARDWMKFHNPKNLAISIVLEASELLEHFQWKDMEESADYSANAKDELSDEIADIAVYLLELCDNLDIDLEAAIRGKLTKNAAKYPVEKAHGVATKYTKL